MPHHGSHALLCQTCQNILLIYFNYIPHEMCKIAQIARLESAARGVSAQGPPSTSEPKQNTELHSQKYIQQTWLVVISLPWACFETRSDRACWPVTLLGLYSESKLSSASAWLPNQHFAVSAYQARRFRFFGPALLEVAIAGRLATAALPFRTFFFFVIIGTSSGCLDSSSLSPRCRHAHT